MRILFCTLDYAPSAAGGAERQAQLQAEGLQRRGHAVEVVCPRVAGHRSGVVNGVQIHRLPRLPGFPLRPLSYLFLLAIFLMTRLRGFHLVHVHLANLQADVAVTAAEAAQRPSYVKVAAGGPLGEIGRFHRVATVTRFRGLRRATVVQAISQEIADDLRGIGVNEDRIIRIPNGVPTPHHAVSADERQIARQQLNLPPSAVIVLYAGRMEVEKGVEDLLAAWNGGAGYPNGHLLLIGSPGLKHPAGIENLPAGAEHRAWSADIAAYLRAADIFVLPSHAEGMSNALLEAMAVGLPCIATRVGAAPDMVSHGRTGLLVDRGDRVALSDALTELWSDPQERSAMGLAARQAVTSRFGIESVVDQVEAAYRAMVSA